MICLVWAMSCYAQDTTRLKVLVEGEAVIVDRNIAVEQVKIIVDSLISEYYIDNYLEAAIDTIELVAETALVLVHKGQQYQDIYITPNNNAIEYAKGKLRPQAYPYKEALALKESLLVAADDSGFPFAEIKFKNIQINEDRVAAEMHLILNRQVLINELKVIGDARIRPSFLGAYLGLSPGKELRKSQLANTQKRLDNLPFVSSNKKPNVVFNEDGADVYLFAKEKNASRFDAIVGLLPVNDPLLQRSVIFTANGAIDLINTLQRGERIFFEFSQLRPLTQDLNTEVSLPYFAGLPFGVRGSFSLSKQDTSFLDLDYTIGAQYLYGGDNYIEVFVASDITRLLNVNEQSIIATKSLPSRLDTRIQYYGVQWRYHNLDNIVNPRNGWLLQSKFMIGAKEIRPSSLILNLEDPADEDFDFQGLYDGQSKQDQLILSFDLQKYFSIGKQSALRVDLHGAGVFSEADVFDNERFRIGGNQLLRGFNEQNFFTDRYLLNTLEYRFTLVENSVLFVFSDFAILQLDKSKPAFINPWGIGAGINFETAAGILSLSAGVGRDLSNPDDFFDLGAPRIHIGYVNLF